MFFAMRLLSDSLSIIQKSRFPAEKIRMTQRGHGHRNINHVKIRRKSCITEIRMEKERFFYSEREKRPVGNACMWLAE